MNINEARQFVYVTEELKKLSHQLNSLYTANCNVGLTDRQEKRQTRLQDRANELAEQIGFICYHQTDPRGASIYLIDETMNNSNYGNGVVIW